MKLDFIYNGNKYIIDFDDVDCVKYNDGTYTVLITVNISFTSRLVKNNKINWLQEDEFYISKNAQNYINRMIALKVFA
jgi:hypothetical protein